MSTAAMTGGAVAGYATQQAIESSSNRTVTLGLARCNLMEAKQQTMVCIDNLEEKLKADTAMTNGLLMVALLVIGFIGWWTTRW